jgi:hypothetical protein
MLSRLISEPGRLGTRFLYSGAWSDSLQNPASERLSLFISGPGRLRARFLYSGAWSDSPASIWPKAIQDGASVIFVALFIELVFCRSFQ